MRKIQFGTRVTKGNEDFMLLVIFPLRHGAKIPSCLMGLFTTNSHSSTRQRGSSRTGGYTG